MFTIHQFCLINGLSLAPLPPREQKVRAGSKGRTKVSERFRKACSLGHTDVQWANGGGT